MTLLNLLFDLGVVAVLWFGVWIDKKYSERKRS